MCFATTTPQNYKTTENNIILNSTHTKKMLDITSPYVSVPAALFAILSPGLFLQLPDRLPFKTAGAFSSMKTSQVSVFTHACVLVLVYQLLAGEIGLVLTKTDLIVVGTLFLLLSPGMLLTLPPGSNGIFLSGQTSLMSISLHTIVFALVFAFLRTSFPQYY